MGDADFPPFNRCLLLWTFGPTDRPSYIRIIQVNYQYRNGTSFPSALRAIYADGGIPRFYRGVVPALFQGPLSRFGDTAANTGVLTLLDNLESTQNLNVGVKTVAASAAAAGFRIFLMPIDTVKVRVVFRRHSK